MRPPDPPPPPADHAYLAELGRVAVQHGVSHWGVAPAGVMHRARSALAARVAAGLSDTMQFTYKNPQRSTDPGAAVRDARSVFVAAYPYEAGDDVSAAGTPSSSGARAPQLSGAVARYAWDDYYGHLRRALRAVVLRLRADGWKAVAFADDNSLVDREVAYLAGLGWFGKNANLLLRGAGSWFVLGSVVTTADLPLSSGPVADGCGPCTRCMVACPTAAIVAPGVIDAGRCLSWILQRPGPIPVEFRQAVGRRIYGCDDCQTACPPTVVFGRRWATGTGERTRHLPLVELLAGTDDEVMARWGRWYLAHRDPRWVRRNALVALGNVLAEPTAQEPVDDGLRSHAVAALRRYVDGIDTLLAEHAAWALWRAGGRS